MLPSLPFKENFTSGRQLIPGQRINSLTSLLTSAAQVTAVAGGQAAATPLNAAFVEITVCAVAGNGVLLPPSQIGLRVCITNSGAADAAVYPNGNESITSAGAGVSVVLAAGSNAEYVCAKKGSWSRYISA